MSAEKNSHCDNVENREEQRNINEFNRRYFESWLALLKFSITLNGFALVAALALWGAYNDKSVGFEVVASPIIWFSLGLVFALITLIIDFCILRLYLFSDNLNKLQQESKNKQWMVAVPVIVSYLLFLLGILKIFLKALCVVVC